MQVKKKEVGERILEAARAEFAERGYKDASLTRIAERAGVSAGNFYTYYSGKDELLGDVVDVVFNFIPKFIADLAGTITVLDMPLEQFSSFMAKELYRVFWKHRTELDILLHKCGGTKYEKFSEIIGQLVYGIIVRRHFGEREISDYERVMARVVADGYLGGVLGVLGMEWNEEEFTEMVRKLTLFFFREFDS